ncbi:MAG: GNAT family N-acetyltransferase [Pirellulaceae bacterium]
MSVVYFKRSKMELQLDRLKLAELPECAEGIRLLPWSKRLLNRHAEVKWQSFREEIDAHVFPCLADLEGCRALMLEITNRKDFAAQATWLACRDSEFTSTPQPCGTIQGLLAAGQTGAIQNLGVHPECRGLGIGKALLVQSLIGFQAAGCKSVQLEVTVQNTSAIKLYEQLGFEHKETLFKISDLQYA